jgi:hypothetical protein
MVTDVRLWVFVVGSFVIVPAAQARQWTDATGKYSIEADLLGFDDENVVLQRADKELGVFRIDQLSEKDREFLKSKDDSDIYQENVGVLQTWTTQSGLKLVGRLVDYARGDIVIQRRRGRMYVNDRAFDNLPELYQQLVPKVVEHFEEIELPDRRALLNWLRTIGGEPRTFLVEGVILEVDNGDEYAIPFFVFTDTDRKLLQAGWEDWLAIQKDYQQRDDHAFRLQAQAAAYAKNQKIDRQIALMNLNLQAIRAGLTSAWEVTLYPVPGNPSPPRWVVMPGRNSAQASAAALKNNPGFSVGPVRRVSD